MLGTTLPGAAWAAQTVEEQSAPSEIQMAAEANNALAADLYGQLSKGEGNLFFSPVSLSMALSMTYAGAKGDTATEMRKVLHFKNDQNLPQAAAALNSHLRSLEGKGDVRLSLANSIWPKAGLKLQPEFLKIIEKYFGAAVKPLDFANQQEASRATINKWVEEATNNKINNLIASPLPFDVRLILVDAVYFKGLWQDKFDPGQTLDSEFKTASGPVKTPFMNREGSYRSSQPTREAPGLLELPYGGGQVSMLIILPQAETEKALGDLEKEFSSKKLADWRARLTPATTVKVEIPKFRLTWGAVDVAEALKNLGLKKAFSDVADFSGLAEDEKIFIDQVLHKAFVEVSEEGTEAAAATAVIGLAMAAAPTADPVVFRADHPFMFLIQDNETGAIIFVGRVVDPSKN